MSEEGNNISCLNSRAIIEYLRGKYPDRLHELFSGLPTPWSDMPSPEIYLSEENNWIPSSLIVKLFANARAITGDPDVAFHIGFDSMVRREFSYIQRILHPVPFIAATGPQENEPDQLEAEQYEDRRADLRHPVARGHPVALA